MRVVSAQKVDPAKSARAKEFRRAPTESEARAWELLRDRRCHGLKFRRQQVIRGFIADFYCSELSLVVEIDGSSHADRAEADAERDTLFQALGIRVLRIPADSVLELPSQIEALLPRAPH